MRLSVRGHIVQLRVHTLAWKCLGCRQAFTDVEVMHETMGDCRKQGKVVEKMAQEVRAILRQRYVAQTVGV